MVKQLRQIWKIHQKSIVSIYQCRFFSFDIDRLINSNTLFVDWFLNICTYIMWPWFSVDLKVTRQVLPFPHTNVPASMPIYHLINLGFFKFSVLPSPDTSSPGVPTSARVAKVTSTRSETDGTSFRARW